MSHIVQIKTQVRDAVAIQSACRRLGLAEPILGTTQLFSGAATGWAVHLANWRFPVVFEVPVGKAHFDNFEGRWGAQAGLDAFLQAYAVEKARLEAHKHGHTVSEQALPDGSIKLTIEVGVSS